MNTNTLGEEFLKSIREIIEECGKLENPARAARVTAFAILVMLDGSHESIGQQYKLLTDAGQLVEFHHHDL